MNGQAPEITQAGLVGKAGEDVRHPELRTGWKVVVHPEDGGSSVHPDTAVIVRPAPPLP